MKLRVTNSPKKTSVSQAYEQAQKVPKQYGKSSGTAAMKVGVSMRKH